MNNVLILYPPSHKHLGLFKDLDGCEGVYLRCTELRAQNRILRKILSILFRFIKNIPYKQFWFTYHDLSDIMPEISSVIVVDGALNTLQISDLYKMKQKKQSIKFFLYFINSIDAASPIMNGVRKKYLDFKWDEILTFDEVEAKKYGFKYLGFCYYSKQNISISRNAQNDIYYVGGNKGGRMGLIYDTFYKMSEHNINVRFDIYQISKSKEKKYPGLNYFTGRWMSYREVLENVQNSRCILEVMQDGQNGATLRYFEAVCYNKKLLTTNQNISKFPYYDSRWMRVFKSADDIDWNWLKSVDDVDYKYRGDFSPIKLIEYVKNH